MNPLFKAITNSQNQNSVVSLHKIEDLEHKILIEELELQMSIGILPEEKKDKQRVLVSLEISTTPASLYHDDINNTVSYADIIKDVESLIGSKHFNLVETLAEEICALCFRHGSVQKVFASVKKPDIITNVKNVGFSMVKSK